MALNVQMVRQVTSQASVYIGLVGQLIVDLGTSAIRVHDGATPGGNPTAMANNNGSDFPSKPTVRANLGLGSAAQNATTDFDPAGAATIAEAAAIASAISTGVQKANNLTDLASIPTSVATLGLTIGSETQAWSALLDAFAASGGGANNVPYFTGASAFAMQASTAYGRSVLDLANAAAAQTLFGCPSDTGAGASGTWGINISGNAATSTNITAYTINQNVGSGNSPTFAGLTINGSIGATGDITAFASDDRLKDRGEDFKGALYIADRLDVFFYEMNAYARSEGLPGGMRLGLSAQQIEKYLPVASRPAPFNEEYLTYQDQQVIPFLVACIKELRAEIQELKSK